MNEKLRIELCSDTGLGKEPFYAALELPATAEQIRDAKQRARIVSADDAGSVSINIIEFDPIPELEEVRLDTTTVEELNFLAMRMAALCEEQFLVYRALFDKRFEDMGSDGLLSVKDLINMTYGIDDVVVASGIDTDEQLGQFVIENDLHPDIAAIPDDSLYLLDKKTVGKLQRESEGGVFFEGRYIAIGTYEIQEVYDGKSIPMNAKDGVFRMKIVPKNAEESTRPLSLSLPIDERAADADVLHAFGEAAVKDCVCIELDSCLPNITKDALKDMTAFVALNLLASRYLNMSEEEQIKLKAVLEAEGIESAEEALAAADRLNEYELSYFDSDASSFFKTYLAHNLDQRIDSRWLDSLSAIHEGERLIELLGASVTAYGILSARGGQATTTKAALFDRAEKLELIELLGRPALFTSARLLQKELPEGLYKYDLREGVDTPYASIEPSVAVDHTGTVITKEPIYFDDEGYIELDEDDAPCFTGEEMSIEEFLNSSFDEAHENTEELGGMKL
jgi:hypothetical protein